MHYTDKNLHRSTQFVKWRSTLYLSAEWQAEVFARNFLAPEELVRLFTNPDELCQNLQITPNMAVARMSELDMLPRSKIVPDTAFLDQFRRK